MEKNKKVIGPCPICGSGQIVEHEKRYACTNEKNWPNPCKFYIHKEIKSAHITPDIVAELLKCGQTGQIEFINNDGNPFKAKLQLTGNTAQIVFDNVILKGRCPICGGRVQVTENGYNCENKLNKENACTFHINKTISNREITRQEVENFLEGKIEILDNFTSCAGNNFSAFLEISDEGYVRTSSRVSICPKCGGRLLVGTRAFNCENYRTEGCTFRIPRRISGHKITYEEVKQLCEEGEAGPIKITLSNGKTIERKITFDHNYRTITV